MLQIYQKQPVYNRQKIVEMVNIQCYNCQQTTPSQGHSAQPVCPHCGSEAVEFIVPQPSTLPAPRMPFVAERLTRSSPMGRFMQNMMVGRSMFPGFDDDEPFFGNMSIGGTIFERMTAESLAGGQPNVVVRQVFSSGPGQQTVITYTTNLQNNEWQPIPEPFKPRVENYPEVKSLQHQCAVCQSNQKQGVVLPCGHQFHKECLTPWFEVRDTCPSCRFKLTQQNL